MIFPDPSVSTSGTCYQGDGLKAYKNGQGGIGVLYDTQEARFSNIVSIDNTLGLTINSSGETDTEKLLTLKNSFIYGETADLAKDCPDHAGGSTGANCYC